MGKARPRLSTERLRRVATAAFGKRWQYQLAESMGVNDVTVARWSTGEIPVSAKSEAIIVALCVARCRANLAEALKVRREVATLAKAHGERRAAKASRPPDHPTKQTPWWVARGQTWHEARGLPEPQPKPPKQKRKRPGKLRPYKRRARKAPSEKQLAYWSSEAVRENGRRGLAKGRAVRLGAGSVQTDPKETEPTHPVLGEQQQEPTHSNDSSSDALSQAAEAGPGQVGPSS